MPNPIQPSYAQPAPIPDSNCLGCGGRSLYYPPLVVPGGAAGKPLIIEEGPGIDVLNLSDSVTDHYVISQDVIATLEAEISVIAKAAGVAKSNPILIGTIIDELIPSWSYNGPITTQVLSVELGGSDEIDVPILAGGPRTADLTDGSITEDATISILGNNGQGFPQSQASASAQITFGNNVAWGDNADLIGGDVADLQYLYDTFSKAVQTTRAHSLTTTGGANEYFIYLVPARFGEVTFQKGIFVGGYRELLNVEGVLVTELGSGDEAEEILLENEAGYIEAYRIYQSLYDNKNDPDTPTIAS